MNRENDILGSRSAGGAEPSLEEIIQNTLERDAQAMPSFETVPSGGLTARLAITTKPRGLLTSTGSKLGLFAVAAAVSAALFYFFAVRPSAPLPAPSPNPLKQTVIERPASSTAIEAPSANASAGNASAGNASAGNGSAESASSASASAAAQSDALVHASALQQSRSRETNGVKRMTVKQPKQKLRLHDQDDEKVPVLTIPGYKQADR